MHRTASNRLPVSRSCRYRLRHTTSSPPYESSSLDHPIFTPNSRRSFLGNYLFIYK